MRDSASIGCFADQDAEGRVLLDPFDDAAAQRPGTFVERSSGRGSAPTRDANRTRCGRNR